MQESSVSDQPRGKYAGMLQIIRFNWRVYVAALLICGAVLATLALLPMPNRVRWLSWGFVACTGYWMVASLLAAHWIYDRSEVYHWTWIKETLPFVPRRWANVHVGLDESSAALKQMFPTSEGVILDVFTPAEMPSRSISEARRLAAKGIRTEEADFRALPFSEAELDTVFLLFSAHEIRKRESRHVFFRELQRVLKPGGCVLLVEHLRDFNNFLAFGPGYFHFHSRSAWHEAAGSAQFRVEKEFSLTPFVRIFLLRKST